MIQLKVVEEDIEKLLLNGIKAVSYTHLYITVFEKGTATLQNTDVKGLVIRPVGVPYTCLLYTSS